MADIIIEVKKGMVIGLYCDIEDARFVVVDWDTEAISAPGQPAGIEQDHSHLNSLPSKTRTEYLQAIA